MVDDEPELVNATVAMLAREVGDKQVRGSIDSRDVAGWIDAAKPTVLITDLRMPHVTGLDLVSKLHERWGPVPVIVITAYPTAQVHDDARAGRFAFLPKPFSFSALRETILRVCSPSPSPSFSGAIAVSMLGEVVQLYGLANRTGTLRVTAPDGVGEIAFESGRVTDASSPGRRAVAAFNTILSWTSGSFGWDPTPPLEHTIHGGLSELLIEAYRLRDEQEAGIDSMATDGGGSDPDAVMDLAFDALMGSDGDEQVSITHKQRGNVDEQLKKLEKLDGFSAAALYDMHANASIAAIDHDDGPDINQSVAAHVELVQVKRDTLAKLQLDDDIEDIVITMPDEYHLLRLCRRHKQLFFFLTLNRRHANLAMARYLLANVEQDIVL